jgi:ASC-1-like (ASCH) protein
MVESFKDKPSREEVGIIEVTLKNKYLEYIKSGKKTVEVRINSGQFRNIKVGDKIKFFSRSNEVVCEVTSIDKFSDFKTLLEDKGVENVIPDCFSVDEGVRLINSIPTFTERCRKNGCIAFGLKVINQK